MKTKLGVVEDLIVENFLEIKLLLDKLEVALSTISKKEVKENVDVTEEDEKEKSCESNEVGDAGIDANSPGFGGSNDKEEKSDRKIKNKKKKKEKTVKNNSAGNDSEGKENNLVATEGHAVLVVDNKARLETMYEQSRRFGGLWYKCVVCSYAREARYINEVRDHIVSEHWDALNQAVNTTREEVVAGVETVNCFKNALDNLQGRGRNTKVGQ